MIMEDNKHPIEFREIVEYLLRKHNIHIGIWGIYVEFANGATNAGEAPDRVYPSAIVGVKSLGIIRVDAGSALSTTSLCVDAAVINPEISNKARKRKTSK